MQMNRCVISLRKQINDFRQLFGVIILRYDN